MRCETKQEKNRVLSKKNHIKSNITSEPSSSLIIAASLWEKFLQQSKSKETRIDSFFVLKNLKASSSNKGLPDAELGS